LSFEIAFTRTLRVYTQCLHEIATLLYFEATIIVSDLCHDLALFRVNMSDESKAKSPSVAPEEIKACFICPITREIMHDPCFTCDGHTFERVAIQTWFAAGNATSPLTNLGLPSLGLVPNHALRGAIEATRMLEGWVVKHNGGDAGAGTAIGAGAAVGGSPSLTEAKEAEAAEAEAGGGGKVDELAAAAEEVWRNDVAAGLAVDMRDSTGNWCEATVTQVEGDMVKISYAYWTSKWDEWIHRCSPRIQTSGSHEAWGALDPRIARAPGNDAST
jgi:hypothetical protein